MSVKRNTTKKHTDPRFDNPTSQLGVSAFTDGAGFTDNQVKEIYKLIHATLQETELLGKCHMNKNDKQKLGPLRIEISSIYYENFQGKTEEWGQQCIDRLIQRVNSNHRRNAKRKKNEEEWRAENEKKTLQSEEPAFQSPGASQTPAASQPIEALPQTSHRPILHLANLALLIKSENLTIGSTMCTVRHVTKSPNDDENTTCKGIDRDMLVGVIRKDIGTDVGPGGLKGLLEDSFTSNSSSTVILDNSQQLQGFISAVYAGGKTQATITVA